MGNLDALGNVYAQKGLEKACFVNPDEEQQAEQAQRTAQEPVVKKADEDPNKGLQVQSNPADEDPVEAYNKKAQEIVKQNEQALKNLGKKSEKDKTNVTADSADENSVETFNKTGEQLVNQNKRNLNNRGIIDQKDPMAKIKESMKNSGIEYKDLEYSGTWDDYRKPKTYEDKLYRYKQMRYNGQLKAKDVKTGEMRNLTDAELEELAQLSVENDKKLKKVENTHVFMDKAEYEQKEGEKNGYMQELIAKGVSEKDAQAKADEKYGVNNYLHDGILGSKARRFIEKYPKLFNDENGKFSEQKLKDFVIKAASCLNGNDDEISGFLSLDERRKFKDMLKEEGINVSVDTLGKLAKAVGMDKEYNPTFLLRTGVVAVATGAGAAIGAATGGAVAFGTFNACGQLCNGIIVPGAVAGAVTGAAVGGATTPFLAAKGKPEPHIPSIRPLPTPPDIVLKDVPPEKPCPPQYEDAFCTPNETIKRGDNWNTLTMAKVTVNNVKLADSERNAKANAYRKAYIKGWQLQYNLSDKDMKEGKFFKVGDKYKMYTSFSNILTEENLKKYPQLALLKDATIEVDCNASAKPGEVVKGKFGLVTDPGRNVRNRLDCNGNLLGVEEY